MDRRFIITVVCTISILIIVAFLSIEWNHTYNIKSIAYRPPTINATESFTVATREIDAPSGMTPRKCNIYYTSNIDLCDDTTTHWYRYPRDYITSTIASLNTKKTNGTITPSEDQTLTKLKRVMTDYDDLPFKQYCKLEMYGMTEPSTHPYKINLNYDAEKRGDPSHWAFCLEDNGLKNSPSIKSNPAFTKVFEKSGLDIKFPDGTRERYDMKSLANDHLVDLHCVMYNTQQIQSGDISPVYNDRDMIEVEINPTTRRIIAVKPVYYNQAGIYLSKTARARNMYRRFIEVLQQPTQFIIRQRSFKPTIYRLLFNLCNATALTNAPNPNATYQGDSLAHPKSVELIVERQKYPIDSFFVLPQQQAVYITGYGDISDLVIDTKIYPEPQ